MFFSSVGQTLGRVPGERHLHLRLRGQADRVLRRPGIRLHGEGEFEKIYDLNI